MAYRLPAEDVEGKLDDAEIAAFRDDVAFRRRRQQKAVMAGFASLLVVVGLVAGALVRQADQRPPAPAGSPHFAYAISCRGTPAVCTSTPIYVP